MRKILLLPMFLLFVIIFSFNAPTAGVTAGLNFSIDYYRHSDVLLVCNPLSVIGTQTCNYFMSQRPTLTHVLNLTGIVGGEGASDAQYLSILNQIRGYLNSTNDTINYIVLTNGIPILSGIRNYLGQYSVDSMLMYDLRNTTIFITDFGGAGPGFYTPYQYGSEIFSFKKFGFYIVTRLDGYTFEDVKALIDHSSYGNIDQNALVNGKFVIDQSGADYNYYDSYSFYKEDQRKASNNLTAAGYNVVFQDAKATSSLVFLENETNVVGYDSWGSNDDAYFRIIRSTNYEFMSWSNQTQPTNWTVASGTVYNSSYRVRDPSCINYQQGSVEFNNTGVSEIYQNFTSPLASSRRNYFRINFGSANLTGNITFGFSGFDSSGNLIYNSNTTLNPINSTSNCSGEGYNYVRYIPSPSITTMQSFVSSNIMNGSFYLDFAMITQISPSNTWTNGSIGTTYVSTSGRSFSNTTPYNQQSLIADLIQDGISGAEGFVTEPYVSAIAVPLILFDRYSKGYNLGDSFYMASANSNWKDVIIGDPKTVIISASSSPVADVSAPNITQLSPIINTTSATIIFDVTDMSGIANCTAVVYNNTFTNSSLNITSISKIYNNSILIFGLVENTTYSSYVNCTDSAGNRAESQILTWKTLQSFVELIFMQGDESSVFGRRFNASNSYMADGNYVFMVYANDTSGNENNTVNVSFVVDTINPMWVANGSNLSSSTLSGENVYFNISFVELNPGSYIFEWYNGTAWENTSGSYVSGAEIKVEKKININVGAINWTWYASDLAGNVNKTDSLGVTLNTTFEISSDDIPPLVTINSPTAGAYAVNNYLVNIILNEEGYCEYSLNSGANNKTLTNTGNTQFSGTESSVANGNYVLRAYCNDSAGNVNNAKSVSFSVAVPSGLGSPGGSSGGGGGGGGAVPTPSETNIVSESKIVEGYESSLNVGGQINFEFVGESHSAKIDFIGNDSASITISSEPITLSLKVGETKEIDLNRNGKNDLAVSLNKIAAGKAYISLKGILESGVTGGNESEKGTIVSSPVPERIPSKIFNFGNNRLTYILIGLVVAAIIVIVVFLVRRRRVKDKDAKGRKR